jgi:hypothetical protein
MLNLVFLSPLGAGCAARNYVQVAETLTGGAEQRLKVAQRMFSAPDLPALCAGAGKPSQLIAESPPLALAAGSRFPLDRLRVAALDESGRRLAGVPIAIEAEEKNPPLLDLRSDRLSEAKLLPLRAGRVTFRARTICPGPTVEVIIPAVVRAR